MVIVEKFINDKPVWNNMQKGYELLDVESVPSFVQEGHKNIVLKVPDIVQYAQACRKIKNSIERAGADIVLCTVPGSYITARVVRGMGLADRIEMLPSLESAPEKNICEIIEKKVCGNRKDSLAVSIIDCWKQGFGSNIDYFLDGVREAVASGNYRQYQLFLNIVGVGEEDYESSKSGGGIVPDDFERNVVVNWRASQKMFAVPDAFLDMVKILGVRYEGGDITKIVREGGITLHDKSGRHVVVERKSKDLSHDLVMLLIDRGLGLWQKVLKKE